MATEKFQQEIAPPWLADDNGLTLNGFLGGIRADERALLKEAVKARWPTLGPDDALGRQGLDRQIEQAPGETLDAFRARITDPFATWYWAGTKTGIRNIFLPWGFTAEQVLVFDDYEHHFAVGEWHSRVNTVLDSVGGQFTTDGLWSGAGFYDDGGSWDIEAVDYWDGPGVYDDGGLWGTEFFAPYLSYIRRSYRRFKSPGSYPVALYIVLTDAVDPDDEGLWASLGDYDDGGSWGTEPSAGGELAYVRIALGNLWDENAQGDGAGAWDGSGETWTDYYE